MVSYHWPSICDRYCPMVSDVRPSTRTVLTDPRAQSRRRRQTGPPRRCQARRRLRLIPQPRHKSPLDRAWSRRAERRRHRLQSLRPKRRARRRRRQLARHRADLEVRPGASWGGFPVGLSCWKTGTPCCFQAGICSGLIRMKQQLCQTVRRCAAAASLLSWFRTIGRAFATAIALCFLMFALRRAPC